MFSNWNGNVTSGMALTFYVIWGIRHGIWSDLFGALAGEKVITGSRAATSTTSSSSNANNLLFGLLGSGL